MDINENFEDYHRHPTFLELFETKLMATHGTSRYQIKDMDIIFLLIPFSFLWVEWFGYYSLLKSSIFWKCWKLIIFTQHWNSTFWYFFSKGCHSKTNWDSDMKPKPIEAQNAEFSEWERSLFWIIKFLKIERLSKSRHFWDIVVQLEMRESCC